MSTDGFFYEEGFILDDVKKMLGINPDDTSFDLDIEIHTRAAIDSLEQLSVFLKHGVGYGTPQTLKDLLWSSLFTDDSAQGRIGYIKTYVYLWVKRVFDPPVTGFATNALDKVISELEWRIGVHSDWVTKQIAEAEPIVPPEEVL